MVSIYIGCKNLPKVKLIMLKMRLNRNKLEGKVWGGFADAHPQTPAGGFADAYPCP